MKNQSLIDEITNNHHKYFINGQHVATPFPLDRPEGLTNSELIVLSLLGCYYVLNKGEFMMSNREIGKRFGRSYATASRIIKSLEEKNFLKTRVDGRNKYILLT